MKLETLEKANINRNKCKNIIKLRSELEFFLKVIDCDGDEMPHYNIIAMIKDDEVIEQLQILIDRVIDKRLDALNIEFENIID